MPWFGSGSSVKVRKNREMYWVAEDGRARKRGGTSRRQNEYDGPPPAGILKRSGRGARSVPFQFEDGMVPQEMAAAIPMPSEQKVNAMFTEMVVRDIIYASCVFHDIPVTHYI